MAEVAKELAAARKADQFRVKAIHARFTYRMHGLSQFMKSFMQGQEVSRIYRRAMALALGRKIGKAENQPMTSTAASATSLMVVPPIWGVTLPKLPAFNESG